MSLSRLEPPTSPRQRVVIPTFDSLASLGSKGGQAATQLGVSMAWRGTLAWSHASPRQYVLWELGVCAERRVPCRCHLYVSGPCVVSQAWVCWGHGHSHSNSVALSPMVCTPCRGNLRKQEGLLTRSLCPQ